MKHVKSWRPIHSFAFRSVREFSDLQSLVVSRLLLLTGIWIFVLASLSARENEPGSPSPEDINDYAKDCVARNVQMDLVKRFGTNFQNLDLRGVDFKGVYQVGMETILSGADFSGSDLRGVDLGAALLDGAVFRDADLRGARFTTAKLENADFTGAKIGDAHFQECFFIGATLTGLDFSQATLNGCFFENANLDGAVLQGVRNDLSWRRAMSGASLRGIDLTGFDFSLGNLAGADLSNANLTGANFEQANLRDSNLSGAVLDDVVVDAAILDGVTGLDAQALQTLRDKADRAGFEAHEAAKSRWATVRKLAFVGSYWVVALGALIFSGLAWKRGRSKAWSAILTFVNVFALVAPLFYFLLSGHFNLLESWATPREIGGFWVVIWPVSLLNSMAMILIGLSLVISLVVWAARQEKDIRIQTRPLIVAAMLTDIHGIFLWAHSFANAPTV